MLIWLVLHHQRPFCCFFSSLDLGCQAAYVADTTSLQCFGADVHKSNVSTHTHCTIASMACGQMTAKTTLRLTTVEMQGTAEQSPLDQVVVLTWPSTASVQN